ncbi:PepSY-associated TM helix domain-containing protein [bacterium]|nr:PepSY-associated TM helix domain-containing protein [bacterium]
MRKWLYRIHMYGGLLCFPYLIVFGFSSLNFNHRFAFANHEPTLASWEAAVRVAGLGEDMPQAEALRDSLGLMGWPLPWETERDSGGVFQFGLSRPGKHYTVHYYPARGFARVEEQRFGFWRVFGNLHAMERIPGSRFSALWPWYTEFCTFFVLFAGVSGIALWTQGRRERLSGLVVLAAVSVLSLLFMLLVWLRG